MFEVDSNLDGAFKVVLDHDDSRPMHMKALELVGKAFPDRILMICLNENFDPTIYGFKAPSDVHLVKVLHRFDERAYSFNNCTVDLKLVD